mmetsp:Transcript_133079/g.297782  ORF Transcript_133079/g.297782 Transcript_133079/m.297782 type:complete len:255 (+) Transcript_133079:95-859(+)
MSAGIATKWRSDLQKAQWELKQVQNELHRWELLAGQSSARGERGLQGSKVRGRLATLRIELDRLKRELDGLSAKSEGDVTRKTITQYSDELDKALDELQKMQLRVQGSSSVASSFNGSSASSPRDSTSTSFVQLAGDASATRGTELPSVQQSQRQRLQQQEQDMRDLDQCLGGLEGSVSNLQQVTTAIRGEIQRQNGLLDDTNEATDRVTQRLGRARTLLQRFTTQDRQSRYLVCLILLLLAALIAIFIYVLEP